MKRCKTDFRTASRSSSSWWSSPSSACSSPCSCPPCNPPANRHGACPAATGCGSSAWACTTTNRLLASSPPGRSTPVPPVAGIAAGDDPNGRNGGGAIGIGAPGSAMLLAYIEQPALHANFMKIAGERPEVVDWFGNATYAATPGRRTASAGDGLPFASDQCRGAGQWHRHGAPGPRQLLRELRQGRLRRRSTREIHPSAAFLAITTASA